MASVICLGPTGSGKTLLIKKLLDPKAVDDTTTSVPTVGTNLFTFNLGGNKNKVVIIRELGGEVAPLWPKYYDGIKRVIFVVDASNLCQISAAGVLFYSILVEPKFKNAQVLLVLSKMDVSYRQMRNEALLMLQMKRLQKEVSQNITIVESSAITGEGCEEILKWLKN